MSYLLDLLIVVVVIINIAICIKRGFLKALFRSLGLLCAILIAVLLTSSLAGIISDHFMHDKVYGRVDELVSQSDFSDNMDEAIEELESKTEDIRATLESFGVDTESIVAQIKNDVRGQNMGLRAAIVNRVSDFVSSLLSHILAFIILFAVSYLTISIVYLLLVIFTKLPVLNEANKILGGVLGAVKGFISACVFAVFFGSLLPEIIKLFSDNSFYLNAVNSTYILKTLVEINPLMLIIKLLM